MEKNEANELLEAYENLYNKILHAIQAQDHLAQLGALTETASTLIEMRVSGMFFEFRNKIKDMAQ